MGDGYGVRLLFRHLGLRIEGVEVCPGSPGKAPFFLGVRQPTRYSSPGWHLEGAPDVAPSNVVPPPVARV